MSKLLARRILATLFALYCVFSIAGGIVLAELSLRLPKLPLGDTAAQRARLQQLNASVEDVSITASDGAILKAWLITPSNPNGRSVIILHGVTANRIGSTGFAEMFLNKGYTVLVPDSRDHGESGGAIATYGILERYDINLWVRWMRRRAPGCTYLLGESMGAAIGLQAEAVTPDLCAVAVESPTPPFAPSATNGSAAARTPEPSSGRRSDAPSSKSRSSIPACATASISPTPIPKLPSNEPPRPRC